MKLKYVKVVLVLALAGASGLTQAKASMAGCLGGAIGAIGGGASCEFLSGLGFVCQGGTPYSFHYFPCYD